MPDQYAVIGNPIGHTKSPLIHGMFAASAQQDISYIAIEGQIGNFAAQVDAFRAAGGRGLNITAPFKLDAFAYANEHTQAAQLAGAVNCLKFEGDRIIAQNFDGVGLTRDITHNLAVPMKGKRVLLLGAGGAVRGALLPFLSEEPLALVIVNRHVEKAQGLANDSRHLGPVTAASYDDVRGEVFDLVINATSASLTRELPPIDSGVFAKAELAYDLAYGKGLTPFLKAAKDAGVPRIADGVGMLAEQAAEAFAWWRGVRPQTQPVIEKLTIPLV